MRTTMSALRDWQTEAAILLSAQSRSFRNVRPNGYYWRFPDLLHGQSANFVMAMQRACRWCTPDPHLLVVGPAVTAMA